MNMIEKIARAINALDQDNVPYEDLQPIWLEIVNNQAKAAIEAMREPTEAMINQAEVHWDYSCQICGGVKHQWQLMIDAALKED